MPTFDPPIYIKPTDPKGDVITFGKRPELELSDAASGIARFGGNWRAPSYLRAYLRAADVLVNHGMQTNTLDDIGLPAFYMLRHALELLTKRLLSWAYEYAEAIGNSTVPTKNRLRIFKKSHDIPKLLEHLTFACEHLGFSRPPEELAALVAEVASFEKSETWARYDHSESKDIITHHLRDEVELPLVALQRKLEDVAAKVLVRFDGTDAYEDELYWAWRSASDAPK